MSFSLDHLKSEVLFEVTRSSGPGGQNVNRTNSSVILRWNLIYSNLFNEQQKQRLYDKLNHRLTGEGEIMVRAETHRDQLQNKSEALQKLYSLIVEALKVPKPRKKTKPTRSSQRRRMDDKSQRGDIKQNRRRVKDY